MPVSRDPRFLLVLDTERRPSLTCSYNLIVTPLRNAFVPPLLCLSDGMAVS